MRKHLYVDNVDLATYGVYISGQGTFGAGEREYAFYDVPSRDGALVGAQTRLANVSVSCYNLFHSKRQKGDGSLWANSKTCLRPTI